MKPEGLIVRVWLLITLVYQHIGLNPPGIQWGSLFISPPALNTKPRPEVSHVSITELESGRAEP